MTYQYIDLTYLDTISSGDKDLSKTLLEMVHSEISSAISTMSLAHNAQNWEEFHEISHKLKATLAFVGNQKISQTNQKILSHLEEKRYEADFSSWLDSFKESSGPILHEIGLALSQL